LRRIARNSSNVLNCVNRQRPMSPHMQSWPIAYFNGSVAFFEPTQGFGAAYLGGPLQRRIDHEFNVRPVLHRVFTLELRDVAPEAESGLRGTLPLLFGIRHDGCRIEYTVPKQGEGATKFLSNVEPLALISLNPSAPTPDWPYEDYPAALPYIPLSVAHSEKMEASKFARAFTWQGVHGLSQDELCVIVPSLPHIGVSMWGREGDLEAVQTIFRFSLRESRVVAETQVS
jgi:hypothetical protein